MRKALTITLLAGFPLFWGACSPGIQVEKDAQPDVEAPPSVAEGFPTGWSGWAKFNEEPISRQDEARDLHYNARASGSTEGAFPAGTVLVKAHYRGAGDSKPFRLSVMTKGSGSANGGWSFSKYSPAGQAVSFEPDGCAVCHSQRAGNDFVFSNRSGL